VKQVLFILLGFISIQGFSQSVKIRRNDSLEVMKTDLGQMNWWDAKEACEKLGDGWRLPTLHELIFMCDKRDEIGGFKEDGYWGCSDIDDVEAWYFGLFSDGPDNGYTKDDVNYVRAVRTLK
jgi:hypothetical protein